ncbi:hypothetical protein [Bacillus sp. OTU2372]|uniref:hypothetical protein n=1 Tax=Bacillus sp. OTU2372 TaxID=3043858 RepID=UPI00313B3C2D
MAIIGYARVSTKDQGTMASILVQEYYKTVSNPDDAKVIYIGEVGDGARTANSIFFEINGMG